MARRFNVRIAQDSQGMMMGKYGYLPIDGISATALLVWDDFDGRWEGTKREAERMILDLKNAPSRAGFAMVLSPVR